MAQLSSSGGRTVPARFDTKRRWALTLLAGMLAVLVFSWPAQQARLRLCQTASSTWAHHSYFNACSQAPHPQLSIRFQLLAQRAGAVPRQPSSSSLLELSLLQADVRRLEQTVEQLQQVALADSCDCLTDPCCLWRQLMCCQSACTPSMLDSGVACVTLPSAPSPGYGEASKQLY